jgi:hypothetical protein
MPPSLHATFLWLALTIECLAHSENGVTAFRKSSPRCRHGPVELQISTKNNRRRSPWSWPAWNPKPVLCRSYENPCGSVHTPCRLQPFAYMDVDVDGSG